MAPKKLHLIEPNPSLTPAPPRPLGQVGQDLWISVTSEYGVTDSGGREMLAQACAALDRAEALRVHIDRDGEVTRTKAGIKAHPGLKDELAARAFVVRTLHRLGLDVEAIKAPGRPPGYGF